MKSANRKLAKVLVLTAGLGFMVTAQANGQGDAKEGDFLRGAKAWADNCTRCHNVRDPKELRDDQWITTVHHMRVRGGLTGQQTRDIIKFLQESN